MENKFTDQERARVHAELDVLLGIVDRPSLVVQRFTYENIDRRSARAMRRLHGGEP